MDAWRSLTESVLPATTRSRFGLLDEDAATSGRLKQPLLSSDTSDDDEDDGSDDGHEQEHVLARRRWGQDAFYEDVLVDDEDMEAGMWRYTESDDLLPVKRPWEPVPRTYKRKEVTKDDMLAGALARMRARSSAWRALISSHVFWPWREREHDYEYDYEREEVLRDKHTSLLGHRSACAGADVESTSTMTSGVMLRTASRKRRRTETMEELHERALVRLALITLGLTACLIFVISRHSA